MFLFCVILNFQIIIPLGWVLLLVQEIHLLAWITQDHMETLPPSVSCRWLSCLLKTSLIVDQSATVLQSHFAVCVCRGERRVNLFPLTGCSVVHRQDRLTSKVYRNQRFVSHLLDKEKEKEKRREGKVEWTRNWETAQCPLQSSFWHARIIFGPEVIIYIYIKKKTTSLVNWFFFAVHFQT